MSIEAAVRQLRPIVLAIADDVIEQEDCFAAIAHGRSWHAQADPVARPLPAKADIRA
jgi:hypothetical protein